MRTHGRFVLRLVGAVPGAALRTCSVGKTRPSGKGRNREREERRGKNPGACAWQRPLLLEGVQKGEIQVEGTRRGGPRRSGADSRRGRKPRALTMLAFIASVGIPERTSGESSATGKLGDRVIQALC